MGTAQQRSGVEDITMRSPIAWVGGKSKLAKWIVSHFPRGQYKQFVDVFGGSAAVLLACDDHKDDKVREVFCDVNGDLVNFFNVATTRPAELVELLNLVPYSRAQHKAWRREVLDGKHTDEGELMRAVKWYASCRRAFSCWLHRHNCGFQFQRKPGTTWAPRSFRSAIQRIQPLAERFNSLDYPVLVESKPCWESLETCERDGRGFDHEETLFYLDPPYLNTAYYGEVNTYYESDDKDNEPWNAEQDVRLSEMLNAIDGRAVLSYYEYAEMDERYPPDKWRRRHKEAHVSSGNYRHKGSLKATEVLLMNFDPPEPS